MISKIRYWEYLLYPELREFEPDRQVHALRSAAGTGFDAVELIGLAVALFVTVLVTRYSAAGLGFIDRVAAGLANFVVAIALLLVLGGPFYVRRTRRGLRTQLAKLRENTPGER